MRKSINRLVLLYICFYCTLPLAKTLEVNIANSSCSDNHGQPFCHINSAVKFANADDIINIANGRYVETIFIDKNLKLIGNGRQKTVIDGGRESSVIVIAPGIRSQFKSLAIQNGYADKGGGILNHGSLLLDNVQVSHNWAEFSGGGIYNASSISGSLYIKNSMIEHNQALGDDKHNIKYGGGGIYNDSPLSIENTTLQFNQAVDNGGGLYSIHTGRRKSSDGEIIAEKLGINAAKKRVRSLRRIKDRGSVTIKNSYIQNNYADAGGGINIHGVLNIVSSFISDNHATNGFRSAGGGIFVHFDTNLNLSNVMIGFNKATFRGGGVRFYTVGKGSFSNVSIIDNEVIKDFGQGAGIFIIKGEKALEIQNTLIARNYINGRIVGDCYGAFQSLGNNYFSSVKSCTGFDSKRDIHEIIDGVDHLYQWDVVQGRYKALSTSLINEAGDSTGCKNDKGFKLVKDIYGNKRHIDSNGDGTARCDIGAIEYIPKL